MKKLITLLALFLALQSHGQSDKYGFKDFQFGDSLSKWILQLSGTNSSGGYLYAGSCCKEFLDFKADKIFLYFDEGKLYKVMVFFPIPDFNNDGAIITDDIQNVFASFDNYFGEHNAQTWDSGIVKSEWTTSKMSVLFMFSNKGEGNPYPQIPKLGTNTGYYSSIISIVSLSYLDKQKKDKF